MTDFTNIAALVAQGQSLLDLVKGGHITQLEANNAAKLGEVDAALAAKIAQANIDVANATAPINDKIPRIQLTKNQELVVSSGTVPDGMMVNSGVTVEHVLSIAKSSDRDAAQVNQLNEVSNDIKEIFPDFDIRVGLNHSKGWSIVRLSWDFGVGFSGREYLAFMESFINAVPKCAEMASAAIVKLESGAIDGQWTNGCELGKWRFCSESLKSEGFGWYWFTHPFVTTSAGSVLVALPVVTTGVLDHPKKLFKNIEIY
jgi:hypothetical protein